MLKVVNICAIIKIHKFYSLFSVFKTYSTHSLFPHGQSMYCTHVHTCVYVQHIAYSVWSLECPALLPVLLVVNVSEVPVMAYFGSSRNTLFRESWWLLLIRVHFVEQNINLVTYQPMAYLN